ncbi:MAG: TIGR03086 family metal-binding protein [Haloechinothrix sp.]
MQTSSTAARATTHVGATIEEVGDSFDGDVLGADPESAYASAAQAAVAAISADGALGRTVHLSFGEVPGEEYAWQLFADHLIHSWDLARAIGADQRLDPDLVEACAGWFSANEKAYRSAGAVGPTSELPAGADQQTALLVAFGRTPGAVAAS